MGTRRGNKSSAVRWGTIGALVVALVGIHSPDQAIAMNASNTTEFEMPMPMFWQIYFQLLIEQRSGEYRMTSFPWVVSLQKKSTLEHLCSANILSNIYLLTTCRCLTVSTDLKTAALSFLDPEEIFIVAGLSKIKSRLKHMLTHGQLRSAAELHVHPKCSKSYQFDFAIVEMDYYLYNTPSVQPIPQLLGDVSEGVRLVNCQSAGWGGLPETDELEVTDYAILSRTACLNKMSSSKVDGQFVCASASSGGGYLERLPGRGGSGLFCEGRLVAILTDQLPGGQLKVFTGLGSAFGFLGHFLNESEQTLSSGLPTFVQSSLALQATVGLLVIFWQQ